MAKINFAGTTVNVPDNLLDKYPSLKKFTGKNAATLPGEIKVPESTEPEPGKEGEPGGAEPGGLVGSEAEQPEAAPEAAPKAATKKRGKAKAV
jgi:hypothetical protein